ncbi:sulfite exporter TauE/SafE family protein [Roseovarius nubinhibens]|uniref:Probable membrane transporter protein n=1 Tax=Roseovarius nubinhibens (strain ATCC BAA-591 / DSM 15170 / ISM) TaxID=89187 RepID=A3SJV2_ROSNI|nr:membrane protein, putative [Roseovarius nubinhibens ISM]
MGEMGWEVMAVGAGAALFAGISKGGFGSGAAFVGAAVLALFVSPGAALAIMLPLLLAIDAASLRAYWRQWDWALARHLLLASVPGVLLGALVYRVADADLFRLIIGVICLGFVAWRLWPRRDAARRDLPPWAVWALAGLAGFTSYVSHAGGPAVAVVLLARGVTKTVFQATTVLVFGLMNLLKFALYAGQGMFSPATLWLDLWLLPFALAGTWIGVMAHHRIPERWFFGLTYGLLIVTGLRLVQVALS